MERCLFPTCNCCSSSKHSDSPQGVTAADHRVGASSGSLLDCGHCLQLLQVAKGELKTRADTERSPQHIQGPQRSRDFKAVRAPRQMGGPGVGFGLHFTVKL